MHIITYVQAIRPENGALKNRNTSDYALSIDELYPREPYSVIAENALIKGEEFREKLGATNVVGFSWLLKPEASTTIATLAPSIEDILFSEEYYNVLDKNKFLLEKCRLTEESIKEIAQNTVWQYKNEAWLILRKMRLTASHEFWQFNGGKTMKKQPWQNLKVIQMEVVPTGLLII
ncbi:unnamed protein product [Psylliodes chrysocephalus]|uniref:Uncharacterized protein n=1 Tax=Psylliodes chrysocephalus TaxID=3402493 RepID=A0A9P0CVF5_9CUCU|nr:unnamed protein product [Psylliodes chrysocephala]